MTRTTEQWKELLDAANVAEDLEVRYDDWDEKWQIGTEDENDHLPGWWYIAELESEPKARLLASAPDAVAEVIRLRKALEEVLDVLGQANYGGDPDPDYYTRGEVDEAIRIGRWLTRILNGDTE